MNNKEQVPAIHRYKIGFHSDEWGMRSSNPGGIQDASGSWVRYEDHVAVIAALRARIADLEAELAAAHQIVYGMDADLTDEQIDEVFNQMPDGACGFLKSWGYRQFAYAVLATQSKKEGEKK